MIALAESVFSSSLARLRSTRPVLSLLILAGFCSCCFGQLPADLDLPSETLDSGTLVFQASNSITNSASLLVQDPASVTLSAGSYIRLEPGFNATAGSTFHAVINPNVVNWQPIPVPAPPTACTDCGLNYAAAAGGLSPQDIYAPNITDILYAVCLDQYGNILACNLSLSVITYEGTNGHYHNFPLAPASGISPSSGNTANYPNWQMPVTLTTTQVGQIETISVVPTGDAEGPPAIEGYYTYAVGYLNFVYMDNSDIFMQTGGNTTNHGNNTWNHYMTVNAATGLQQAATSYVNTYNPGQKICINDMALPIGGKFDIHDNWTSPHKLHDAGTAVDVPVKSGQCTASYLVNSDRFKRECSAQGASYVVTESGGRVVPQCPPENTSCHVHCQWPY